MWYKRAERQYRIALFFSAASLAGAFGGVLAYGISFMNGIGGYQGWVRHLSHEVVHDISLTNVCTAMDIHHRGPARMSSEP
jgi:hypothetical protein